jgi:tRNA nucleotidyltransferase/poly(A) polymerase
MSLKNLFAQQNHWPDVQSVVRKLNSAGFIAYVAGGAVRDLLLGENAKDFDIATDATPDDVEKIFTQTIAVGRQFGVMIVPFDGHQIEITTFRKDGEYTDGRHPSDVKFCAPEEDAKRRDFTVNALFYDIGEDRVIDYVEGLKDLEHKILRTVGEASQRFSEDKLRVLRAVRFAAQLNFSIESKTLAAVNDFASQISAVSPERITEEMKRVLQSKNVYRGIEILRDVGLLSAIWPELQFYKNPELWQSFLLTLAHMAGSLEMFIAICFIFEKQHFKVPFVLSREQKRRVEFLVRGYEHLRNNDICVLHDLNESDGPLFTEMALALAEAGVIPKPLMGEWIDRFLKVADEHGELPKPWVNGDDLLRLGLKASSKFGETLAELYNDQLSGRLANRDEALKKAKQLKS